MFLIFCFSFLFFYFLFGFLVFSLVFPRVSGINRGDAEESLNYGVEWHGVVGGILEITIAAAGFMGHFLSGPQSMLLLCDVRSVYQMSAPPDHPQNTS